MLLNNMALSVPGKIFFSGIIGVVPFTSSQDELNGRMFTFHTVCHACRRRQLAMSQHTLRTVTGLHLLTRTTPRSGPTRDPFSPLECSGTILTSFRAIIPPCSCYSCAISNSNSPRGFRSGNETSPSMCSSFVPDQESGGAFTRALVASVRAANKKGITNADLMKAIEATLAEGSFKMNPALCASEARAERSFFEV